MQKQCTWRLSVICCLAAQLYGLFCKPRDWSPPGSSVFGISQPRILEWLAISFSRGSSQPRDWTHISCIDRWILYHSATRKTLHWTLNMVKMIHFNFYIFYHNVITMSLKSFLWSLACFPYNCSLDGQRGLACCDSWGREESDTTEWLNWTELQLYVGATYYLEPLLIKVWSLGQQHQLYPGAR